MKGKLPRLHRPSCRRRSAPRPRARASTRFMKNRARLRPAWSRGARLPDEPRSISLGPHESANVSRARFTGADGDARRPPTTRAASPSDDEPSRARRHPAERGLSTSGNVPRAGRGLTTYALAGRAPRLGAIICINGAAAHHNPAGRSGDPRDVRRHEPDRRGAPARADRRPRRRPRTAP